jgi:hypothetical protein
MPADWDSAVALCFPVYLDPNGNLVSLMHDGGRYLEACLNITWLHSESSYATAWLPPTKPR